MLPSHIQLLIVASTSHRFIYRSLYFLRHLELEANEGSWFKCVQKPYHITFLQSRIHNQYSLKSSNALVTFVVGSKEVIKQIL